jgi:hypothetical protein
MFKKNKKLETYRRADHEPTAQLERSKTHSLEIILLATL